MESPIHRHNSVIFNYFALIITDFQLFVVSLHRINTFLEMGMPIDSIVTATGLSQEEIAKL